MNSSHEPHNSVAPAATVTRHEEHLLVTTELHATERIRIERVIVTEIRTITVDVRHEELRVTREPLRDDGPVPTTAASQIREPIVLVLHEEQVAVTKTIVPVERVTCTVSTITNDRDVSTALRHEEIDVHTSDASDCSSAQ